MKEIPAYSPRWLSRFFSFLRHLPIPLWIVALAVIFIIGLALHLDAWRRGLLPSGSVAMELAAEGFWLTFLPGLWLYLDRSAGRAIEGFFAEQNKTAPEMEMIVADFLSLPAVAAAGVFLLGFYSAYLHICLRSKRPPLLKAWLGKASPTFRSLAV